MQNHLREQRAAQKFQRSEQSLRLEPEEFIDAGGQILVSLHQLARGQGSGARVVSRLAHVWTMEDGAAVRLRIFADKESALAALQAEEDLL